MPSAGIDYDPSATAAASAAEQVLQQHEARLLQLPGVRGIGVGQNAIGDPAIVVYLEEKSAASRLPRTVGGFDVVTEVTGVIDAYSW